VAGGKQRVAHAAGPACVWAALGDTLALLMAPRGEQALWLQLDQFLVLLAQNAGNGADPTAPPPGPGISPLAPGHP